MDLITVQIDINQVRDKANNILSHWQPASERDKYRLIQWLENRVEELNSSLEDINEDEDLKLSLAYSYIEAKSQWAMYNNQIQYKLLLYGLEDHFLMYKTSLLSIIFEELEQFLSEDDLSNLKSVIADPLKTNKQDDNLFESININMEKQLINLYLEKEHLINELGVSHSDEIIAMVRSLEDQLNELYFHKEQGNQLSFNYEIQGNRLVIHSPANITLKVKK